MTEQEIKEIQELLAKREAELTKLKAEWQSLLDINKDGVKLTEKQSKRLSKIKKDCSLIGLAISVGKEILAENK